MNLWPTNHNKKLIKKNLSIEYKTPIFHSENNDNEQKSKNSNINKDSLNLFKGVVKVTKETLKEKINPEILSNNVNSHNNNHLFDLTNSVYKNEDHLNDDKLYVIKSLKNNRIRFNNVITPVSTLKSKNKQLDKSKSSFDMSNASKDQSMKKSLFKKNQKRFSLNYNNSVKRRSKRKSLEGDITHKNRNSNNFNFFFKLKEKDKIPSKTPYLDKIWNASNKLNIKHKTNIHSKLNQDMRYKKRNTQEFNVNGINKINIKNYKEKNEEIIERSKDEKDKSKDSIEKKQEEKIEENPTKKVDKKNKNIFLEEKINKTNMNVIFNILNKPFFCCLK